MGKDLKIKDSVSSPPYKVWGSFFDKKSFAWVNKLFWENFWLDVLHGFFYQIMQGGKLMVDRLQRLSQVSFSSHWPWPGLLIYHSKSLHCKWGIEFEKHLLHFLPLGLGCSCKACLLFWKIIVVTYFWCLLDLQIYGPLLEKWVRALHAESEESWLKPRSR